MCVAICLGLTTTAAVAQEQPERSLFGDVAKGVALDPSTYAPAILAYTSTVRDWDSSQPFFARGYVEHNARFTVTGRADDVAIGYAAGRRQILKDAIGIFEVSLVNNATSRIIDQILIRRYPQHRTALRVLGWVERVGFASYMSYRMSSPHFRQAQLNEQRAGQLGLR
jgi:hypothetical protein